MERDKRNLTACEDKGWRTLIIWEWALRRNLNEVIQTTANWLLYDTQPAEIRGKERYQNLSEPKEPTS